MFRWIVPYLCFVGAEEQELALDPLVEDKLEGRLPVRPRHRAQEVDHGVQLAVDQLGVHHDQTLDHAQGLRSLETKRAENIQFTSDFVFNC